MTSRHSSVLNMGEINYLRTNLFGLSVFGVWQGFHFKTPLRKIVYKCYGTILLLTFWCFNTSQFVEMFTVITDVALLMQNAGVTLLYVVVLVKAASIHFRTKRIKQLFLRIKYEEARAYKRGVEELNIYNETLQENNFKTVGFWIICYVTLLGFFVARPAEFWILGPQEIHNYQVPFVFSSWFPFDRFYSPANYGFAYAFQILGGCIGASYIAVADSFYVGFIMFGIGQFKMIQSAIRNLHTANHASKQFVDDEADLNEIDVYEEVTDIVKHHCRIIEYYGDLDNLINPIIFMQFLITSLMICAVGLDGIMSGLSVRLVLSLEYIVALLIELLNYYWHANEVTLESANVGRAIAECKWYKFSPRVKQALIMIMLRSEKPATLSVGGFYVMSLETYVMILKSTYSFLALFRQMYERENDAQ